MLIGIVGTLRYLELSSERIAPKTEILPCNWVSDFNLTSPSCIKIDPHPVTTSVSRGYEIMSWPNKTFESSGISTRGESRPSNLPPLPSRPTCGGSHGRGWGHPSSVGSSPWPLSSAWWTGCSGCTGLPAGCTGPPAGCTGPPACCTGSPVCCTGPPCDRWNAFGRRRPPFPAHLK